MTSIPCFIVLMTMCSGVCVSVGCELMVLTWTVPELGKTTSNLTAENQNLQEKKEVEMNRDTVATVT